MMKKIKLLILPVLLFLFLLNACKSPMDVDTPRKPIPLTKNRILPTMTQMSFLENGVKKDFMVGESFALIDTLSDVPYVWMNMTFESNMNTDVDKYGICIYKFTTYVDSIPINGTNSMFGSLDSSLWSSFTIRRSSDNGYDTTLYTGTGKIQSSISFSFDKGRKELFAFIYTTLYETHYWYVERDTIVTDPNGIKIRIPIRERKQSLDTINFRGDLKFQY